MHCHYCGNIFLWFHTNAHNFVTSNEYYTWKPNIFGYMSNNVLFVFEKLKVYAFVEHINVLQNITPQVKIPVECDF